MPKAALTTPTRQRIITAVLQIIGDGGVAAVTNRRIAREAGVSLGSVTYHFETQHDLLRESLLYFVREEARHFTELADQCQTENLDIDDAASLAGQVACGTALDTAHLAPFELYIHAGRDERLRAAASEAFRAYDRLAAQILTALGVPDAERLAATTVAVVMGLQLRRLATGSPADDLVDALLLVARGATDESAGQGLVTQS
ncbi:TetR/AcrR family transcriptional regulator [Streptomyces sp. HUAS TT20]|uniref:TetR/AcrR family transcriptional regulator n=1 Tax=Streptomyces sp. HUAS TT20 TaxID=3447509 RepID=UPI0021DA3429|nr:TetR/AcrR family transcriptional regulator [Streptomyces sp. HUAS 15-9]UXY31682.1 TetR family transcriptional regulator [Streptomyces sp. HUAS 15-9]